MNDQELAPRCEICGALAAVIIVDAGKTYRFCNTHNGPDHNGYAFAETLEGKRYWFKVSEPRSNWPGLPEPPSRDWRDM